ncbi:MAG: glutamate racemase [Candidatus Melainabacteria bacterium]|nr:MAG: glutamate racemase [Candidatus Melainabacteria bacterium]
MTSTDYKQLKNCRRIGLFDSGVGGLTVLDKLNRLSSDEDGNGATAREFVYLGDTARCPYGDRSPGEIVSFMSEIVSWLVSKNVDGIVVACNTSASVALDSARRQVAVPIFDLIAPTAEYVGKLGRKVGVMATTATVKAKAFSKAIHQVNANVDVVEIACPDLVPVIERGEAGLDSTSVLLEKYARTLSKEKVEVLVWGCTHFPFLSQSFSRVLEHQLVVIDPAKLLLNLEPGQDNIPAPDTLVDSKHSIYVTGDPFDFARSAGICLGYSLDTVNGITVDELSGPVSKSTNTHLKKSETSDNIPIVPAI